MKTRQVKNTIIIILISLAMVFGISYLTQKIPVSYTPGSYFGKAAGMSDDLWVKVEFSEEEILSIEIVDHNEYAGYYEDAFVEIPANIIETQSANISAVSGATKTSNGIKAAVESAIDQALGRASIVELVSPYEALGYEYNPGIYTATVEGYNGDLVLTVVFSENAIEDISFVADGDGQEYKDNVINNLIKPIIKWQTTSVDSVSGATWTSLGVKNALRMCIEQAVKK